MVSVLRKIQAQSVKVLTNQHTRYTRSLFKGRVICVADKKRNELFVGTILIKNGTISMKVGTIAVR